MTHRHAPALLTLLILLLALAAAALPVGAAPAAAGLPARLADTGLYRAGSTHELAPAVMGFSPQYPLWSDGADKRRWLWLPPGTSIDASDPDAWRFPPGTRLWKTFELGGRRIETRHIERGADGRWRYGVYVWNEAGTDARLAPPQGAVLELAQAPGGRYEVPARDDCLACHDSAASPVLGLSLLQLSPDRDPLAPHATPPQAGDVDLGALVARGLLRGLPARQLQTAPRIAARTPQARAALGYLHGNCGHCHNDNGSPAPVALQLAWRSTDATDARVLASAVGALSRYRPPGDGAPQVVVPGRPGQGVLERRMRSRHPQVQMPPLGTRLPDAEGLALIERWIADDLRPPTFTAHRQEHP